MNTPGTLGNQGVKPFVTPNSNTDLFQSTVNDETFFGESQQNVNCSFDTLELQIAKEFCELSGISKEVFDLNIRIVPDIEVDPITKEVISTPIADDLGFDYTRFGRSHKENTTAAEFLQEKREVWQVKIFGENSKEFVSDFRSQDGTPKISHQQRTGRYLAPKGIGDVPYLPFIPRETINAIAAQYGLLPPDNDELFWQWFKNHKEIPLIVTEGAKKALAAISQGHIALSLFGCNCGVNDIGVKPELLPYVEGRKVIIAFDRDTKPETRFKVFKATKKLASKLTSHAKGNVFIAAWDGKLGKGLDDLIAKYPEELASAIEKARGFIQWKLDNYSTLDPLNPLRVNIPNLCSLSIPEKENFICIKSPKATYKTEAISRLIEVASKQGIPVLVLSHREQLVRALAKRFGLEYRTELTEDGKIFGYCLCVDSAHPKANPPLHGDAWEDCWVVLDECEQVIWHLLNSSTCQDDRPAILKTITEVCNNSGKIILADADLTRVSIDYINSLRDEQLTPWVVINEYKKPKKKCYLFDKKEQLFTKVKELIAKGENSLIHTGGQVERSTYGTINLEILLLEAFPHLEGKILRIDQQTVGDPTHPAYGCMEHLDQILPNYTVVIASPTIETGVSIECNHFDGVFCFASGSQTVDAVGQTLERDRSDVPRYIWITDNGGWNAIGNKSSDPYCVLKGDKETKKLLELLLKIDDFYLEESDKKTKHRETWSILAARHNAGFKDYYNSVCAKLSEDYILINGTIESPESVVEENKEAAKLSAEINHKKKCEKISNAPILDDLKHKEIKKKRSRTELERLSEKKTDLSKRYLTEEITPDLVDLDSDYSWYSKIRLHYFLTYPQYVKNRDTEAVKRLTKNTGKAFSPDINKSCLSGKIRLLQKLNVARFFDTDKEWSSKDLDDWHKEAIKCSNLARTHLGIGINPNTTEKNNTPIRCAQKILKKLGLKLVKSNRRRVNEGEEPTQFYKLFSLDPDGRAAIFDRWQERDQSCLDVVHLSVSRNTINNIINTVSDHDTVETPNYQQEVEETVSDPPKASEPMGNDETWQGYRLGQKVWLWRVIDDIGQWHEAVVDKVNPSCIHVQADYFGDMIELSNLNHICPMVITKEPTPDPWAA